MRDSLPFDYTQKEIDRMCRTHAKSRGGAVGGEAITPRYIEHNIEHGASILDFGAGRGFHTERLRALGFDVTPFDLCVPRPTDYEAINHHYDVVFASNVINVQPDAESQVRLIEVMHDLVRPGGILVANYPDDPRTTENGIKVPAEVIEAALKHYFGRVERAPYGTSKTGGYGTKKAPLFIAYKQEMST